MLIQPFSPRLNFLVYKSNRAFQDLEFTISFRAFPPEIMLPQKNLVSCSPSNEDSVPNMNSIPENQPSLPHDSEKSDRPVIPTDQQNIPPEFLGSIERMSLEMLPWLRRSFSVEDAGDQQASYRVQKTGQLMNEGEIFRHTTQQNEQVGNITYRNFQQGAEKPFQQPQASQAHATAGTPIHLLFGEWSTQGIGLLSTGRAIRVLGQPEPGRPPYSFQAPGLFTPYNEQHSQNEAIGGGNNTDYEMPLNTKSQGIESPNNPLPLTKRGHLLGEGGLDSLHYPQPPQGLPKQGYGTTNYPPLLQSWRVAQNAQAYGTSNFPLSTLGDELTQSSRAYGGHGMSQNFQDHSTRNSGYGHKDTKSRQRLT